MHKPNSETRARVIGLSCNGATQARIAEHLGVTEKTLRLHYREQIDFGVEALLARVLGNLASIACRGRGLAAVSAAKYILSCRGGWKDCSRLEVAPVGDDVGDARTIIADKLRQLEARNIEIADARDRLQ